MASKITVNLDTSKENFLIEKCVQGDNITIEANIFENGVIKDLTGHAVVINVLKPDGTFVTETVEATGVVGNKITKLMNEQTTTAYGIGKVMITLTDNTNLQNSTFEFKLDIKKFVTEGAVASGTAVPIVQELTQKITEATKVKNDTDTLIKQGGAARGSSIFTTDTEPPIDGTNTDNKPNDWYIKPTTNEFFRRNGNTWVREGILPPNIINNLNQIAGGSVLDASQGYVLKKKIDDNCVALLDDLTVPGAPATTYKKGDSIAISKLTEKNMANFNNFYTKLQGRELIKIECVGDSMTFGQTTAGQSTTPYPAVLQTRLREDIWWNAEVLNNGKGGDTAQTSYERNLTTDNNADCVMFMLGTNDVVGVTLGNPTPPTTYIQYMEQAVIRRILQGEFVILLTPPKSKDLMSEKGISLYAEYLKVLGMRYNIPVIDTQEIMKNYKGTIFSDDTHYTDVGYSILGTRLSTLFYTSPYNPKKVSHGDVLLTRHQIDGCWYNRAGGLVTLMYDKANGVADESNVGNYLEIKPNGNLYYPIYTTQDNLVALPNFEFTTGSTFKFQLDFGINQADDHIDNVTYMATGDTINQQNTREMQQANFWMTNITKEHAIDESDNFALNIVTKGWHVLKVTNTGTAPLKFRGISFMDFDMLTSIKRYKQGGVYRKIVEPTELSVTVNLQDLRNILHYRYELIPTDSKEDMPLKVTVYNDFTCIYEYLLILGKGNAPALIQQIGTRIQVTGSGTDKDDKSLNTANISIDRNANTVTFNFTKNGTENKGVHFMIQAY